MLQISDLKNKMIAVLGYGVEGKAVTKYLMDQGIKPVLFDQMPFENWSKSEMDKIKLLAVNFIFGPDCYKELSGFDVVFRSPGIKASSFISNCSKGVVVTSQTKFFFDNCSARIIGVKGTKGKGTTSSLICDILSLNSKILKLKSKVYLTGNIGKVQPLEIIDNLKNDDFVVYELSSFQLQDLQKSPHVGVVLMVTKEHLDYHKDETEYIEAKTAVTKFQTKDDFSISNLDFKSSLYIGELGLGKKLFFSRKMPADCFAQNNLIYFDNSASSQLKLSDLQLRGEHNLENVCASILAAKAVGVDNQTIIKAVKNFKGLEHRLEFVIEKDSIKFYNDSFSTTPETAIAAIKSFNEPEILIMGGSSKNSDFYELGNVVANAKNIKCIILIGQEALRIKKSIDSAGGKVKIVVSDAKDMPGVFLDIKSVAEKEDVVVLSPGCASYDMFTNYKERGEKFKTEVLNF